MSNNADKVLFGNFEGPNLEGNLRKFISEMVMILTVSGQSEW
jgi:hypothetical protein